MKKSRVLEVAVDGEADVPYDRTHLATQAKRARPRLAALLLLGAAGFGVATAIAGWGWALAALASIAIAWGAWRGRLGAVIAAGLVGALAAAAPIYFVLHDRALPLLALIVWGIALLPDVVLLIRDHELQHAYGLWARR